MKKWRGDKNGQRRSNLHFTPSIVKMDRFSSKRSYPCSLGFLFLLAKFFVKSTVHCTLKIHKMRRISPVLFVLKQLFEFHFFPFFFFDQAELWPFLEY